MLLRTISYYSPMLCLVLIFSACTGFYRDGAAWSDGTAWSDGAARNDGVARRGAEAGIENRRRWKKSFPNCFAWKLGVREDWPESGNVVKSRGVLYPGGWMCTLMGCNCCNACGTTLAFIPRAELVKHGARGKGRPVFLAGKSRPLGYSAMDCEIGALNRMPLLEVVVSGRLDDENESTIVDAKVCVLGELPRDSVRLLSEPARR